MKTLVKSNQFFPEMPSIFDDFLMRDLFQIPVRKQKGLSVPSVNIRENDESYELEVAAPGMKKEDFRIQLEGQVLTISAARQDEKEQKGDENYTRREFSYSSFERSFNLPEKMVDIEKITAKYNDGILHLIVPKAKEALKPSRLISIE